MTQLMGIVNVTPDSFYMPSRKVDISQALERISEEIAQGADWIDIGAESTRPYSKPLSPEEELNRLEPLLSELKNSCRVPFSIDTRKALVAKRAVAAGASMINDIEGFRDEDMRQVALESEALLCVMHMPTTPETMQLHTHYPEGIVPHLINWFSARIALLTSIGIDKKRIILDPGIGFGKTVEDNVRIIKNLPKLKALGFPLLLGISRKSFMQKILKTTAEMVLPATLAINSLAIFFSDVDFIRVHDIAEHRQLIDLMAYLRTVQ
jgi:dihydropteroate synthase